MTSITEGRDLDAEALLKKLMEDILRFTGDAKQHDDTTIIVLKVEPNSGLEQG